MAEPVSREVGAIDTGLALADEKIDLLLAHRLTLGKPARLAIVKKGHYSAAIHTLTDKFATEFVGRLRSRGVSMTSRYCRPCSCRMT